MNAPQLEDPKLVAQRKARVAVGVTVASVVLTALHLPVLGGIGIAVGAFLGYRWVRYRIDHSLRF